MAVLHLPLTIAPGGALERATTDEDVLGSRLLMFIESGAGEYLRLPSPGIRALWIQLYNLGVSARICDSMEEEPRRQLEITILEEINTWLDGLEHIEDVTLLGDAATDNGIRFRTSAREFIYSFKLALPGISRGAGSGSVGPWNIIGTSNVIH